MDEGTDVEFKRDADGRIPAISVIKGGILSLFGPKTSKGTRIISANASASIRGTTTYFAWEEEHKRTYVCCRRAASRSRPPMTRRWIIMMTTSRLLRCMRGGSRAGCFPAGR